MTSVLAGLKTGQIVYCSFSTQINNKSICLIFYLQTIKQLPLLPSYVYKKSRSANFIRTALVKIKTVYSSV
jgi:hypothetical protein